MSSVDTKVAERADAAEPSLTARAAVARGVLPLLLLALVACWAVYRHLPPAAANADAPASQFSAGRAISHVRAVSGRPRPTGSKELAQAREYIVGELKALGLAVEVQTANVTSRRSKPLLIGGTVNNIVARLKGTGDGKAVMLSGHYDSGPTSLGASDDGSAVAILLETARALKAAAPLRNDVIFLFTDAEEVGRLGASAFAEQHPSARDVRLALNFEARGTAGTSLMFETGKSNGWLIRQFAAASDEPVASSFFYEVYKFLPNDTDLSVFKDAGYPGLNFAYFAGFPHYHTLSDTVENLDQRSLQQQGAYALDLARRLGDVSLENTKDADAIYFNLPGSSLIHYRAAWVLPLTAAVLLLTAAVLVLGVRRRRLTIPGVVLGFLAQLLTIVGAAVVVTLVSMFVRAAHSDYRLILQGTTYNSHYYLLGFTFLAVAVATAFYAWLGKRLKFPELMCGGLLCWAVLMILTAAAAPGASYLFTWPLLFGLVATGALFLSGGRDFASAGHAALFCVCAVPGVVLMSPIIYLTAVGLPLNMFRVVVVFIVLQLALLIPPVRVVSALGRWLLPGLAAAAALGFIVAGSVTAGFDRNNPKPDNIFYALNGDTGKAVWASFDRQPDEWTAQFFPAGAEKGSISEYAPTEYSGYLKNPAPAAPLPAPQIDLLGEERNDSVRTLRVRVTSPRGAPFIFVSTEPAEVVGAELNGARVGPANLPPHDGQKRRWGMFYYAPPAEGFTLTLAVKTSEPLKFRAMDQSYELPEAPMRPLKPRPDYIMPTPYPYNPYNDSTLVSKTFIF
jgi:hypothetical protein